MYERDIEKAVCEYARSKGMLAYKFSSPNCAGAPDRIFFAPIGKTFLIEFKRPGGKVTSAQQRIMLKLASIGIDVFVVDNVESGKKVVGYYL